MPSELLVRIWCFGFIIKRVSNSESFTFDFSNERTDYLWDLMTRAAPRLSQQEYLPPKIPILRALLQTLLDHHRCKAHGQEPLPHSSPITLSAITFESYRITTSYEPNNDEAFHNAIQHFQSQFEIFLTFNPFISFENRCMEGEQLQLNAACPFTINIHILCFNLDLFKIRRLPL